MKFLKTFEDVNNEDYTLLDINKIPNITTSHFDKHGDKQYGYTYAFKKLLKELLINKIVTFYRTSHKYTCLITDVFFYLNGEMPAIFFKIENPDDEKMKNISSPEGPFKIWSEDSDIAQDIRLKLVVNKYNL